MDMRPTTDFSRLSDEQKQSLDWTRSIAVRANAGSGKTTVLVQRIIQILHNRRDLTLERIVAITFTRKAGAQLKQKLHETLTECASASPAADRGFWQKRLDELSRCPIGTIDFLCHRLLKTAIDAGVIHDLDPAFEILEGIDWFEMLDLAIRRAEIDLNDDPAWKDWLRTQGRYELKYALRTLLIKAVDPVQCHVALESYSNIRQEQLLRMLNWPSFSKPLDYVARQRGDILRAMDDALREIRRLPKGRKPTASVQEIIDFLTTMTREAPASDLQFIHALKSGLFVMGGTPKKKGLAAGGECYFPLLDAIQQAWSKWIAEWKIDVNVADGLELTRKLLQVYQVAHRHYRDLCREDNRYDFDFLARRVVQLLDNPDHARRLTESFSFILVDEFQDTNELQWRIVARLAGADPSLPVATDKLMIVGDPQQSIYRFRRADPTVFERTIELIQKGNGQRGRIDQPTAYDQVVKGVESSQEQREGLMRLHKNYRSLEPLPIRVIDKLSTFAFQEAGYRDPQHLKAGLTERDERTEVVCIFPEAADQSDDAGGEPVADDGDSGDFDADGKPLVQKLEADQLELVARELIRCRERRFDWKEMAVLLRSRRTHLTNLETTLTEHGIPYQLVGGLGFWQRQEVRDLVCLANCLANGADELALFAVLRGPLCALNDSELLFLSALGGRRLLTGLHRFASIHKAGGAWDSFQLDDTTIAALREALAQIADDRKAIVLQAAERLGYDGMWRQRVDRMPHSELLLAALDESGAWAVYADDEGERRLANLRLFFDEVRLLEAGRSASLSDTARRLKKLVDESTNDEQAELTPEDKDAVHVMTVHAAKGLEFKVVAVIGLERRFRTDTNSVVLLDRFIHFRKDERESNLARNLDGLPVITFRDPEMPLLKVSPLLYQALDKIETTLTIAEEARIFHVAITRAERVLILAGAAPRGKTWPRENTWQKWVHGALGLTDAADDEDWKDPADDALRVRIVRRKSTEQIAKIDSPRPEPSFDLEPLRETPRRRIIAATALPEMLVAHRDRHGEWEMRYRHHVQPHSGAIPKHLLDRKKPDRRAEHGKHVGTLVHRALEMGSAFPMDPRERRALLLAHAAALTGDHGLDRDEPGSADPDSGDTLPATIATIAERILHKVLPNNPFKSLLEADGEPEVEFALSVGNWIITGRFDRLIRTKGGTWEIVDWKTDDESADQIVATYAGQMKLYALALYESLPEARRAAEIVVHVAMTRWREARRLVFSPNELAVYRRELEQSLPAI